jgi:hypothetical protein
MFGLLFFLINIIYVVCSNVAITNDIHNDDINGISFRKLLILNIALFALGTVLAVIGYPFAVLVMCLLTVVTWNTLPYIQNTYLIGEN